MILALCGLAEVLLLRLEGTGRRRKEQTSFIGP